MENVKIYEKLLSYAIAGAITFTGFSLVNHTPFVTDSTAKTLDCITSIDENGKVTEEYSEKADMNTATIEYYSKWVKNGDYYTRNVGYYMPSDYSIEEIKEILKEKKNITPSVTTTERTSFLTEEELKNNTDFIKAVIIEKDKKEVTIKESKVENALDTTSSLIAFLLLCYGINGQTKVRKRKK